MQFPHLKTMRARLTTHKARKTRKSAASQHLVCASSYKTCSTAGAAVGQLVGEQLGAGGTSTQAANTQNQWASIEAFGKASLTGFAAGLTTAAVRGGRVSITQVATDAFGSALGNSFAEGMKPATQGAGPYSAANYRNGMDIDSDNYSPPRPYTGGEDFAADAARRRAANGGYTAASAPIAQDEMLNGSNASGNAAFRQAERDYRQANDASVAGSAYRARSGDTISDILGTSRPQDIGNFIRANGLRSDRIEPGRNYFVPDSSYAYGDQANVGQAALNMGNARIEVVQAQARARAAAESAAEVAQQERYGAMQVGAWDGRTNQATAFTAGAGAGSMTSVSRSAITPETDMSSMMSALGGGFEFAQTPVAAGPVRDPVGEAIVRTAKAAWNGPVDTGIGVLQAFGNIGPGLVNMAVMAPKLAAEGYLALGNRAGLVSDSTYQNFRDVQPLQMHTWEPSNDAQRFGQYGTDALMLAAGGVSAWNQAGRVGALREASSIGYSGDVFAADFVGPKKFEVFYRGDASKRTEFLSSMAESKGLSSTESFLGGMDKTAADIRMRNHSFTSEGSPFISTSADRRVAEYFARGDKQDQLGFITEFRVPSGNQASSFKYNQFSEFNRRPNIDIGLMEQEYLVSGRIPPKYIYNQYQVSPK